MVEALAFLLPWESGTLITVPPWKRADPSPASPLLTSPCSYPSAPPTLSTSFLLYEVRISLFSFPLLLTASLLSSSPFPHPFSSPSSHYYSSISPPPSHLPPSLSLLSLYFFLPPSLSLSLFLLAPLQYLDGWHIESQNADFSSNIP